MKESTRSNPKLVQRFIDEHAGSILARLGEVAIPGHQWHVSSHGAALRVEGAHDELFERIIVLLPRPPEAPSDRFRNWAESRLEHYNWYLEMSNTGRCVQSIYHDRSAVFVFMRRLGRSTGDPHFVLPSPRIVQTALARFVQDVRRYVQQLGDNDLKYVNAMRVYQVPRVKKDDEFIISLDVLPTLIGLDTESQPIHPLTLVRGTVGEFAELYDQERVRLADSLAGRLPTQMREERRRLDTVERLVNTLDGVCAKIDLHRPTLEAVHGWLKGPSYKRVPSKPSSKWWTAAIVAACAAFAYFLAL